MMANFFSAFWFNTSSFGLDTYSTLSKLSDFVQFAMKKQFGIYVI